MEEEKNWHFLGFVKNTGGKGEKKISLLSQ